jgi:hypothetical protein
MAKFRFAGKTTGTRAKYNMKPKMGALTMRKWGYLPDKVPRHTAQQSP